MRARKTRQGAQRAVRVSMRASGALTCSCPLTWTWWLSCERFIADGVYINLNRYLLNGQKRAGKWKITLEMRKEVLQPSLMRCALYMRRQASSPNDKRLFPSRFNFFFGTFLALRLSLSLSSPSVIIRRLSLLELVFDFALEDEKDKLGTVSFDLEVGCFLSFVADSSSDAGRGGSPFSIPGVHKHGQKTKYATVETFAPFVLRLLLCKMFPSFQHDHLWFLVFVIFVSTTGVITRTLWNGWTNGNRGSP